TPTAPKRRGQATEAAGLYQEGDRNKAIPIAHLESAQGAIAAGDHFNCPH
ncbi:hypothetical protein MGSAQ_002756, partial [marine sediment metagenome]